MPTTIFQTSTIKTTLPAHDRTITQKGETKIFVSTLPASTVTDYKTMVSTTVCSKGQTVTMPGGSTTVMAQASTLTTTAITQLYSTISAEAATVTQVSTNRSQHRARFIGDVLKPLAASVFPWNMATLLTLCDLGWIHCVSRHCSNVNRQLQPWPNRHSRQQGDCLRQPDSDHHTNHLSQHIHS